MKIIALIAVLTVVLLAASGVLPSGSVGGAMVLGVIYLAAACMVGVHDAWTNKRSVLGWIGSIVAALVGGFVGAAASGTLIEPLLILVPMERSLMASGHPMLYVGLALTMLITLLGAWLALQILNRMRT